VEVSSSLMSTLSYPRKMLAHITVKMIDGTKFKDSADTFPGFISTPLDWTRLVQKFKGLTEPYANSSLQNKIIDTVQNLEKLKVSDLTNLLGNVSRQNIILEPAAQIAPHNV
jgi:2-methylcitrate dehydratase